MNSPYRVVRTTRDDAALHELVKLLDAELAVRNGDLQAVYRQYNSLVSVDAAVVAFAGKEPVACGCFRKFDPTAVEIKRMYVRPERRGSGVAAMLLNELEHWAAEIGNSRTVLETGLKQVEAIRFYTKSGYERTENYGKYVGMENSVCFAKALAAAKTCGSNGEP